MLKKIRPFWEGIRHLSGDDAYERYLIHFAEHHRQDCSHSIEPPLSKKAFFKQWQDDKWRGINRCC